MLECLRVQSLVIWKVDCDTPTTWDLMNFWSTAYNFWALTQEPEYRASPGPKGKGKDQDSCILATVVHSRCKDLWGHLDGCPSSCSLLVT